MVYNQISAAMKLEKRRPIVVLRPFIVKDDWDGSLDVGDKSGWVKRRMVSH